LVTGGACVGVARGVAGASGLDRICLGLRPAPALNPPRPVGAGREGVSAAGASTSASAFSALLLLLRCVPSSPVACCVWIAAISALGAVTDRRVGLLSSPQNRFRRPEAATHTAVFKRVREVQKHAHSGRTCGESGSSCRTWSVTLRSQEIQLLPLFCLPPL
jgi:hypothetical protein